MTQQESPVARVALRALMFAAVSCALTFFIFSAFVLFKQGTTLPGGIDKALASDAARKFVMQLPSVMLLGASFFGLAGLAEALLAIKLFPGSRSVLLRGIQIVSAFLCALAGACTGLRLQNSHSSELSAFESAPDVYIFVAIIWAACGFISGFVTFWLIGLANLRMRTAQSDSS